MTQPQTEKGSCPGWEVAKYAAKEGFNTRNRTLLACHTGNVFGAQRLAPGASMKVCALDHDVITCGEAAAAKHIPLSHELKTLVLDTSMGVVAAHTCV